MAKVLGKGLAALIRNHNPDQDNYIPIKSIIPNPNQPRKKFSTQHMGELIKSISGDNTPLGVRKI